MTSLNRKLNARLVDSGIQCALTDSDSRGQRISPTMASNVEVEDVSRRIQVVVERAYQHNGGSPNDASELVELGGRLAELLLTPAIQRELLAGTGTLAVTCDRSLDAIPWELTVVGDEYLGRQWSVGRIAGKSKSIECKATLPGNISIVANPQFNLLASVRETDRLTRLIQKNSRLPRPNVYKNRVTRDQLCSALENADWFHYAGHMSTSNDSQWHLADGTMGAAALSGRLKRSPRFVFNNACRSVTMGFEETWDSNISIRDFLIDAGSEHYLGTTAPILDRDSFLFAESFYADILGGETIGAAVRAARNVLASQRTKTLGWANYVLYGEPGVVLCPVEDDATAASFPLNCCRCGSIIKTRHGIGGEVDSGETQEYFCRNCSTAVSLGP